MIELAEAPIRRGMVQFRKDNDYSNILRLSEEKPLTDLIEDDEWQLSFRCFQEMVSSGIFKAIDTLYVRSLKIRWWGSGHSFNIIKDVSAISFPSLKELYLNGNLINNIEGIAKLDLRCIEVLNLKQNNICSLKPLRKCHLSNLKQLTLYNNRILDFRPLQEMHAPKLTGVWTTPQSDNFDCQQATSWTLRLQANCLKKAFIKHPRGQTLDADQMQTMMTNKFGAMEFVYQLRDDIQVRFQ